jgi:hypothetical protein
MARIATGVRADQRFVQDTAQSLRRIAARLPPVLDQEVLRVAKELEENATRLKEAG